MKMDITKSPRDIVENRNVKPMQVSSQVAKKASSDDTMNKQCRAAHRQSTRTTVNKLHRTLLIFRRKKNEDDHYADAHGLS